MAAAASWISGPWTPTSGQKSGFLIFICIRFQQPENSHKFADFSAKLRRRRPQQIIRFILTIFILFQMLSFCNPANRPSLSKALPFNRLWDAKYFYLIYPRKCNTPDTKCSLHINISRLGFQSSSSNSFSKFVKRRLLTYSVGTGISHFKHASYSFEPFKESAVTEMGSLFATWWV